MKNLMAVVALILCGVASADAVEPQIKWCSPDGHEFGFASVDGVILTIFDGTVVQKNVPGTTGTGLEGLSVFLDGTRIVGYGYQSHDFWPCTPPALPKGDYLDVKPYRQWPKNITFDP